MKDISRRTFMAKAAAAGAAIPLVAFVSACKSEAPPETTTEAPPTGGTEPAAADGPICDLAKLSDADKAPRTALGYVDAAPDAAKACTACSLYIADNGGCPGCTLFKGPVAPEGTCNSFAPKA